MSDDRPLTGAVRIVDPTRPGHQEVQIFVGRNPGSRGNAGAITLRVEEVDWFIDRMRIAGFEVLGPAWPEGRWASRTVMARVWPDAEGDQWLIADDDEKYVDGPFIEIPVEVAVPMRDVQERWSSASKVFTEWVEDQIRDNGGDDYRDYLTGEITESQLEARLAGCNHVNRYETGGVLNRMECPDCGRTKLPAREEKWI